MATTEHPNTPPIEQPNIEEAAQADIDTSEQPKGKPPSIELPSTTSIIA
ncbi:uncharacterized protein HRG_10084 [Hirsutella rhossiliensis]|uniref:Uncharacterized protein n=1 Tax=Hirsutella rhossiliensis TaxID=111463 RepID=A0A9P8MRA7_9HYPO|nr:uncharacterized protein HRG_10084 [Hirsutella rhossiliensis]KAH0959039.1 hypothetical protein HRG_10084 [Hirsutella rhossiliensis]